MRVEYLYRYPVKGLTAEALEEVTIEAGQCLPWDRAFALAQGDARFDPEQPRHLPKRNFLCLMVNERAALLRSSFDPGSGTLSIQAPDGEGITANALDAPGRSAIGAFLTAFMGGEARGTPRFHHVPGHSFSDVSRKVVSLINLASLKDLEAKVGSKRHRRRFRANLWFSGAVPWAELEWVGRTLLVGGATLQVRAHIPRCPAVDVNPETAERDADPVEELRTLYGHPNLGVYAEAIEGGRIAIGDPVELLPA
ncbi:MAG: MOSC domain-containing protein [Acetobacteraceae bacterium]|nr:MOSC domain-containing protein [Acetobacteraceae bacterium]